MRDPETQDGDEKGASTSIESQQLRVGVERKANVHKDLHRWCK